MCTVPIGITTRNRVVYLDHTLRSLSATDLPEDVAVHVFDDGSDDIFSLMYYDECEQQSFVMAHQWPCFPEKKKFVTDTDLNDVLDNDPHIWPVGDRVQIVKDEKQLGVVERTLDAVNYLMCTYHEAPGVIVMQDDIVFNAHWYQHLLQCADNTKAGIVSAYQSSHYSKSDVKGFVPAVCLYYSREFWKAATTFFEAPHQGDAFYDTVLCRECRRLGFDIMYLDPSVCQHIGVESIVRPGRQFHNEDWSEARMSESTRPPFVMNKRVKDFKKGVDNGRRVSGIAH